MFYDRCKCILIKTCKNVWNPKILESIPGVKLAICLVMLESCLYSASIDKILCCLHCVAQALLGKRDLGPI